MLPILLFGTCLAAVDLQNKEKEHGSLNMALAGAGLSQNDQGLSKL
jgi:hypothetical protein